MCEQTTEIQIEPVETKVASVERILSMSQAEVDDLPYGFVVLDDDGCILFYNRYESRMARLPPERVLGRNFFLEVAPCTRVEAFHGRFRAMVADPARLADRFAFRFYFLHGAQDVTVDLMRVPHGAASPGSPLGGARVFMMVQRRFVTPPQAPFRSILGLDADTGCVEGPLGRVLPLPAAALGPIVQRLGSEHTREVGRALGAAVAESVALDVLYLGGMELPVPPQIAALALDDAMGRAGLGRVALDQTNRAAGGIIGCFLRPAVAHPAHGLAALYEGLLEAALGSVLGRDLRARCLDEGEMISQPWLFALASPEHVNELSPRSGERPDDVAHRLGLLVDEGA